MATAAPQLELSKLVIIESEVQLLQEIHAHRFEVTEKCMEAKFVMMETLSAEMADLIIDS